MQVGTQIQKSRASSSDRQVQRRRQPHPPPRPTHGACALPPAAAPHAASSAAAAAEPCVTAVRPAAACTGGSTGRSAGGCRRSGRLRLGAAPAQRLGSELQLTSPFPFNFGSLFLIVLCPVSFTCSPDLKRTAGGVGVAPPRAHRLESFGTRSPIAIMYIGAGTSSNPNVCKRVFDTGQGVYAGSVH